MFGPCPIALFLIFIPCELLPLTPKAAKYGIQKLLTQRATLSLFKFSYMQCFFIARDQLVTQQNHFWQVGQILRADWFICSMNVPLWRCHKNNSIHG